MQAPVFRPALVIAGVYSLFATLTGFVLSARLVETPSIYVDHYGL